MLLKYMVKQRLTKMTQMLIRMRILSLKTRSIYFVVLGLFDMLFDLQHVLVFLRVLICLLGAFVFGIIGRR